MNRRTFLRNATTVAGAWQLSASSPRRTNLTVHNAANSDGQADAILRSTIVVDGTDPSALNTTYLDMLKTAKVTCWYKTVNDLPTFASTYTFVDQNRDKITVGTSVSEIRRAHQEGKIALILCWQGAEWLANESHQPRTSLRAWYQLGLRMIGLVYNHSNVFGGGCLDPHLGLTRAGKRLIGEMHDLGIVLDIGGHTGEQASFEAIAVSPGRPVVCSHANLTSLNDNSRNISDRLAEAIAKTGGLIGLTAMSDYMKRRRTDANVPRSPQATLDDYLAQFDYLRKLVGADHIALGPDFIEGRTEYDSDARRNFQLFPMDMISEFPLRFVKGFEDITKLPNLVNGLLERGWPAADIRKMLGENWLRVLGATWRG